MPLILTKMWEHMVCAVYQSVICKYKPIPGHALVMSLLSTLYLILVSSWTNMMNSADPGQSTPRRRDNVHI